MEIHKSIIRVAFVVCELRDFLGSWKGFSQASAESEKVKKSVGWLSAQRGKEAHG